MVSESLMAVGSQSIKMALLTILELLNEVQSKILWLYKSKVWKSMSESE